MERAGTNWNKKAPLGTTLLLMCLIIPLVLSQTEEDYTCPPEDYPTTQGICCNKCPPGFKLVEKCHATGQRSNCTPCPSGQFMDQMNFFPNCRKCRDCKKLKHEFEVSPCKRYQNTVCQCEEKYYKSYIDSETYECRRCSECSSDEKEKQRCTREKNTVCECKEDYYRVNNKCEPCKTCSSECKNHCTPVTTLNSKGSETGKEFLISIIAGVAAVAVVLLVLVFLITHVATKRFTKRKLKSMLNASSQPADVSTDSSEVLIKCEENVNNSSVQAVPESLVSEQQQSNLPDCVPLEIKIADLIYTVLDLVPVLQVKQLVRMLGVKDTEIEQAELDHRSCKEAHYQMLRVWAKRGSRAGGGGMLYMPLLQELLDKLRMMHLGGVAEQLETKYGFQ